MRLLLAGVFVIAIAFGAVALDRTDAPSSDEPTPLSETFTINQEGQIVGAASSIALAPYDHSWYDDPNVLAVIALSFAVAIAVGLFGWHYVLNIRTRRRIVDRLARFT